MSEAQYEIAARLEDEVQVTMQAFDIDEMCRLNAAAEEIRENGFYSPQSTNFVARKLGL